MNLRISLRSYDRSRRIGDAGCDIPLERGEYELMLGDGLCRARVRIAPEGEGLRGEASFTFLKPTARASGAAVSLRADRWRRENYVFAPGAVYHGNRFACRKLPYPPYAPLPPEEAGGGYYAVGVRRDIPPAVLAGGLDRRRHKQLRFPAGGPGARQGARPGNLPLHLRPAPDGKRLGLRDVWKRRVLWGYL